jgi:hypothetical protein
MDAVEKSELLDAAQHELMKHLCTQPLSIAEGGKGVIVPGCVYCKKASLHGQSISESSRPGRSAANS